MRFILVFCLAGLILSGCSKVEQPTGETSVSASQPSVSVSTPTPTPSVQPSFEWVEFDEDESASVESTIAHFIESRYSLNCDKFPDLCWNPADVIQYTTGSHKVLLEGLLSPDWYPSAVDRQFTDELKQVHESWQARLRKIYAISVNPVNHDEAYVEFTWAISKTSDDRSIPYTKENSGRWTIQKDNGRWLIASESAPPPGDFGMG